jgi:uncharacterized protein
MSESRPNPRDVDAYIAASAPEARPKLEELRELMIATVPDVDEGISWGVPFYKYHGQLAGFAAYKNHVSFGCASAVLEEKERERLEAAGYVTGRKTIQVGFDQDVPTATIRQLLESQVRANDATKRAKP